MQLLRKTNKRPRRVEDSARKLVDTIPPVLWFMRRHMWQHRKGLSVPQFRALCWVNRCPRAPLASVANHLDTTISTASRVVTGLVEQGLLNRSEASDDRRQISLTITARGKDVMNGAYTAAQDKLADQLGDLTQEQSEALLQTMDLLYERFGTLESGEHPDANNN
jgi:DNA-binding MarR family transcriptional regulator